MESSGTTPAPNKPQSEKGAGLPELTGSMLIYGAVPVIVVLSGGSASPLLFTAIYSVAGAIPSVIYLLLKQDQFFRKTNLRQILLTFINRNQHENRRSPFNIFGERSMLLPISYLASFFFAWALLFIPDIIAIVVLESWPIFFIFVLRHGENNYHFNSRTVSLFILSFIAVAMIVLSDTQGVSDDEYSILEYGFGFSLVVLAMIFTLQGGNRVNQSLKLASLLQWDKPVPAIEGANKGLEGKIKKRNEADLTLFLRSLGLIFSALICFLLYSFFDAYNLLEGFNGDLSLRGVIIATLGGAIVYFFGGLLYYRGTIKAEDLRTQVVNYFIPAASVCYLTIISLFQAVVPDSANLRGITDVSWDWFLVGFLGVFSITVITSFKSGDKRFGLTSLIIALWITGALVFFRDDWAWWRDNIEALALSNIEYFAFLGTTTTIFVLLLGLQAGRNEERARREDQLVFQLSNLLGSTFSTNKYCRTNMYKYLERLDSARHAKNIESSYKEIVSELDAASVNGADHINEAKTALNELTHSKQYRRRLSESVPIILLGLFSIFLALSFRPPTNGVLQAIAVDIFAFPLAAIIAYLIFYLFDIYIDRNSSNFTYDADTAKYSVKFLPSDSSQETVLASVLITLIVSSYIFLYFVKWSA